MNLSAIERVDGPNLTLRLIEPEDAGYVHVLRTNPLYNRNLSQVTGTVEDQRQWIEGYKAREVKRQEFYYVIERKDGTRCGLVRLYEIAAESFTWGSWILDENKTRKAALESAVLSFSVGFNLLGKSKALVDVRVENDKAINFYRRFGMTQIHDDHQNLYFNYQRDRFEEDYEAHMSTLQTEALQ
jgi:RimJ/RimL family protein N-acetyltransferase